MATQPDSTGEHPRPSPQTAASWWGDAGSKLAVGVICAFALGAGAWAINVDRTLARMEVYMRALTDDAPRMRAEVSAIGSRVQLLEAHDAANTGSDSKIEARVGDLDERLRRLEGSR